METKLNKVSPRDLATLEERVGIKKIRVHKKKPAKPV